MTLHHQNMGEVYGYLQERLGMELYHGQTDTPARVAQIQLRSTALVNVMSCVLNCDPKNPEAAAILDRFLDTSNASYSRPETVIFPLVLKLRGEISKRLEEDPEFKSTAFHLNNELDMVAKMPVQPSKMHPRINRSPATGTGQSF